MKSFVVSSSRSCALTGSGPARAHFQLHQRWVPSTSRGCVKRVRVAELLGPAQGPPPTEDGLAPSPNPEVFLDLSALTKAFNPLTESHLLRWDSSDEEDEPGYRQADIPTAGAWEDASQGLEHQPSWIDYRAYSDSDDPDLARGSASLSAVMPELGPADGEEPATPSMSAGALPAEALPSAYSAEAGFQEVPPHELEERLATGQVALLLDVRSRLEFESGHIAGAVNLPLDPELSGAVRAGALDEFRDRPVAVVCASGGRSAQATVRLSKVFKFGNVTNVTGGMAAWGREGLPVQVSPQRPASGGCGCGSGGGGGGGGCQNKQAA